MTLPTSGAIHLAQIGQEAKKPLLSAAPINDVEIRKLPNIAGKTVPGSQISFADFYGATYGVGIGYGDTEFVNVVGAAPNSSVTSNLIYIYNAGTDPVSFAIFCDNSASYSINGSAYVDKSVLGSIKNGDTLQVKMTASAAGTAAVSLTAQYAGNSKSWSVTAVSYVYSTALKYYSANYASASSANSLLGIGYAVSQPYTTVVDKIVDTIANPISMTGSSTGQQGLLKIRCYDTEVASVNNMISSSACSQSLSSVYNGLSNWKDYTIDVTIQGIHYVRLHLLCYVNTQFPGSSCSFSLYTT